MLDGDGSWAVFCFVLGGAAHEDDDELEKELEALLAPQLQGMTITFVTGLLLLSQKVYKFNSGHCESVSFFFFSRLSPIVPRCV